MFLADMNRRYAVKAKKQQDLHRAVDAQVKLERKCCACRRSEWWVRIGACGAGGTGGCRSRRWHAGLNLANKRVRVKQRAGGELDRGAQGPASDVPGIEPAAHAGQKQKEAGGEQPEMEAGGEPSVEPGIGDQRIGPTGRSACNSRSGCACARVTGGKKVKVTVLLRVAR